MEESMRSIRTLTAACALLLLSAASAAAQQTVFLVRHAERADAASAGAARMATRDADPPLSAAGRERAARLASMLRSAGITAIFSTEFRRTRETAAPLAGRLKLAPVAVPSGDTAALVERVQQVKGNVLVVGHSNTIPDLLKRLGIKDEIAIPDAEYDNLFIIVRPVTGEPTLIRLRF
jgi:broad specificity phosphatase PhoE